MVPPPAARKRKIAELAQDDSEPAKPAPRLSRKQKLDAARARAKAAMALDRKNVQARDVAKKQDEAGAESYPESTPSKRRKVESSSRTKSSSKKSTRSATPRKSPATASKIPPGGASTRTRVLKETKEVKVIKLKTGHGSTTETAHSSLPVRDESRQLQTQHNYQHQQQEHQIKAMMQQQQQQQQQRSGAPSGIPPTPTLKVGKVTNQTAAQLGTSDQNLLIPPPARSSNAEPPNAPLSAPSRKSFIPADPLQPVEILESEDDDIPPPPAASLEFQISQQVLANCAASMKNQPTLNQPPPEAYGRLQSKDLIDGGSEDDELPDEEPIFLDEGEVVADFVGPLSTSTSIRRWYFSFGALIFAGIVVTTLCEYREKFFVDFVTAHQPDSGKTLSVPCYDDFPPPKLVVDEEKFEYGNGPCGADSVPCPENGVCKNGQLVTCHGIHYVLAPSGGACVLSDQANSSLDLMQKILSDWTLRAQCGGGLVEGVQPYYDSESDVPLFEYGKMMLLHPVKLAVSPFDSKILSDRFKTGEHGGLFLVGLESEHAYQLKYPVGCSIGLTIRAVLKLSGSLFLSFAAAVARFLVACLRGYPLSSCAGLIAVWIAFARHQNRTHRAKILLDTANVRHMVYEVLQRDPVQPHVALHIRDAISESLGVDRAHMRNQLWPRVVSEMQYDARVRKSKRIIDGNPRDVWTWIAAKTADSSEKHVTVVS